MRGTVRKMRVDQQTLGSDDLRYFLPLDGNDFSLNEHIGQSLRISCSERITCVELGRGQLHDPAHCLFSKLYWCEGGYYPRNTNSYALG